LCVSFFTTAVCRVLRFVVVDHTIGNLVRHELHRDTEHVKFAGYKVEHPLEHKVKFQVKGSKDRDPIECFKDALQRLDKEMDSIEHAITSKMA